MECKETYSDAVGVFAHMLLNTDCCGGGSGGCGFNSGSMKVGSGGGDATRRCIFGVG